MLIFTKCVACDNPAIDWMIKSDEDGADFMDISGAREVCADHRREWRKEQTKELMRTAKVPVRYKPPSDMPEPLSASDVAKRDRRTIGKCNLCDREYLKRQGQKFCSVGCRERSTWLKRVERQALAFEQRNLPKPCKCCGNLFKPTRATHVFCSRKCVYDARMRQRRDDVTAKIIAYNGG